MAITTTGKLRELLATCIERAAKNELPHQDGKNVIGLANQITSSMAVELKHAEMQVRLGHASTAFGKVDIGG